MESSAAGGGGGGGAIESHHRHRTSSNQQQPKEPMDSHHRLPLSSDEFNTKKSKSKLIPHLLCFLLLSLPSLLLLPFPCSTSEEKISKSHHHHLSTPATPPPPCSSMANNTICCDRTTSRRTDICFMRGDIRTHSPSSTIFLHSSSSPTPSLSKNIKPYTRKWEPTVMKSITQLHLLAATTTLTCDVVHDAPAVVFSAGGYTGNTFHEFTDGIVPLYITSQHLNRRVVFLVVEYRQWWFTKYAQILSRLSDYPVIDFAGDNRTHCFPEATVGFRFHDELSIDPTKMEASKTILDFRNMLEEAYQTCSEKEEKWKLSEVEGQATTTPKSGSENSSSEDHLEKVKMKDESMKKPSPNQEEEEKPKLVIMSRNESRVIENERELAKLCEEVGFRVQVLSPDRNTELARIYQVLNSTDALIGVHGAAMTHFLFMQPGSVLIQIVPLGVDWAARVCLGEPAVKMGLRYESYRVQPGESSLSWKYGKDDPVMRDPNSVNVKGGWEVTKKVYLDGQNVRLDLNRFVGLLTRAYDYSVSRKKRLVWNQKKLGRR